MSYHQLTFSLDEHEVGHLPQVDRELKHAATDNGGRDLPAQQQAGDPPIGLLHSKARLTDLLSSSLVEAYGMLMSDRLKDILATADESLVSFLPINLQSENGNQEQYWIPVAESFDFDQLDYHKTNMSIIGKAQRRISEYSPKSAEELRSMVEILKPPQSVFIDYPVFHEQCTKDLVALQFVGAGISLFVSESLRATIEESGCTGLKFKRISPKMHVARN